MTEKKQKNCNGVIIKKRGILEKKDLQTKKLETVYLYITKLKKNLTLVCVQCMTEELSLEHLFL